MARLLIPLPFSSLRGLCAFPSILWRRLPSTTFFPMWLPFLVALVAATVRPSFELLGPSRWVFFSSYSFHNATCLVLSACFSGVFPLFGVAPFFLLLFFVLTTALSEAFFTFLSEQPGSFLFFFLVTLPVYLSHPPPHHTPFWWDFSVSA